jgi:hypothetical protein
MKKLFNHAIMDVFVFIDQLVNNMFIKLSAVDVFLGMFGGWVSSRGTGICVIVEERLTALVYRDILEQALLP